MTASDFYYHALDAITKARGADSIKARLAEAVAKPEWLALTDTQRANLEAAAKRTK